MTIVVLCGRYPAGRAAEQADNAMLLRVLSNVMSYSNMAIEWSLQGQ